MSFIKTFLFKTKSHINFNSQTYSFFNLFSLRSKSGDVNASNSKSDASKTETTASKDNIKENIAADNNANKTTNCEANKPNESKENKADETRNSGRESEQSDVENSSVRQFFYDLARHGNDLSDGCKKIPIEYFMYEYSHNVLDSAYAYQFSENAKQIDLERSKLNQNDNDENDK